MSLVPIVVSTAHPDYKCPWVRTKLLHAPNDQLQAALRDAYYKAIVEDLNFEGKDFSKKSLHDFIENYYSSEGSRMENAPLSIDYFLDGEWHSYSPKKDAIKEMAEKYKEDMNKWL